MFSVVTMFFMKGALPSGCKEVPSVLWCRAPVNEHIAHQIGAAARPAALEGDIDDLPPRAAEPVDEGAAPAVLLGACIRQINLADENPFGIIARVHQAAMRFFGFR